jgi:hypothetical protein
MRYVILPLVTTLVGCNTSAPPVPRVLEPGWYQWVNQGNSPAKYAPVQMRDFDMSARCLCQSGFTVVDTSDKTFRVVTAPDGYRDTIDQEFKSQQHLWSVPGSVISGEGPLDGPVEQEEKI